MSTFEPLFDPTDESSEFEPLVVGGSSEFQAFDFVRGGDTITAAEGEVSPATTDPDTTILGDQVPVSGLALPGGSLGVDSGATAVDGATAQGPGAASGEPGGAESPVVDLALLGDDPVATQDEPVDPVLDAIHTEAREAGYEEGRAQGLEEMKQQLQGVEDILEQVEGLRAEFFARAVQDVGTTIIQIVEQVIRRELSVSSGDVEALVAGILQEVQTSDGFVIRVAEEDAESLRAARPTLLQLVGRDTGLRIEVDDRLLAGGAVVETSYGSIDASISTQMKAFTQTVQAWVDQEVEANDD